MFAWKRVFPVAVIALVFPVWAAAQNPPTTVDQVIDRVIATEQQEVTALRQYSPLIETYIQDMRPDKELGMVPARDHYFLGEADLSHGIVYHSMLAPKAGLGHKLNPVAHLSSVFAGGFDPEGFLEMIYVDPRGFDKQHYHFEYVRREFLGAVRCLVFDVKPLPHSGNGRFKGRIWVEDQDYHVVRFNGVFEPEQRTFGYSLHFDSWRVNARPGLWVPAYIYSSESDLHDFLWGRIRFKSQTRLWGYDLKNVNREEEFSQLTVESSKPIQDQAAAAQDNSPVVAERSWQQEAEENVIDRLQKSGLIAPPGPVDKILDTVVNNLEVTNNLDIQPEVHCRVLLTSTLESFSIGHTIVMSRGLLDVLPDEASLATMIAHELGDILVGQPLDDQWAFNDKTMVTTVEVLRRFSFRDNAADEAAANKKAVEILKNSPYKDKLQSAGLFLRQLSEEEKHLPALISPHLGNRVYIATELMSSAPAIQPAKLDQIAALPLGARIKLDPWSDQVDLLKAKPVPLLSEREKMPFEVTPFMPYLTRYASPTAGAPGSNTQAADMAKKDPQ